MPILYLLPNLLDDASSPVDALPSSVDAAVATLTHLIAEHEKEGRQFLRRFAYPSPKTFRDIPIYQLNTHTTPQQKRELLAQIRQGGIWGLVSDCGMPCLADPGADLVLMAREQGISVRTFSGPSSLVQALVLSGLGGQKFTFHGYLPQEEAALVSELQRIEKVSKKEGSTHLFIETPYRNQRLWEKMTQILEKETYLCVACALTSPEEFVHTAQVKAWTARGAPPIHKRPCIFLLRSF